MKTNVSGNDPDLLWKMTQAAEKDRMRGLRELGPAALAKMLNDLDDKNAAICVAGIVFWDLSSLAVVDDDTKKFLPHFRPIMDKFTSALHDKTPQRNMIAALVAIGYPRRIAELRVREEAIKKPVESRTEE